MSEFSYKAVTQAGAHIVGTVEAVDRRSAVASLVVKGQFVTELSENSAGTDTSGSDIISSKISTFITIGSHRVISKDILAVTSQLSTALRAGLPLLNALEIIREQQNKPAMKTMFNELTHAVSSGESLSEAMSDYKNRDKTVFNSLYLSMIRVGETGGILEDTTAQLANILTREEKIKTSIKNASAYPLFILALGFASVIIVLTWVLPKILATLTGGVAVLPWPTRMLMGISSFLKMYGWLVFIAVVIGGLYFRKWKSSTGRLTWDTFKLKIPILGSVLRTLAVGRFARMLGALTKGGVGILESLGIVRDTLGNEVLAREIDTVAEKVKTGSALAPPLGQTGLFPPLLVQIVSIGEQTGKLDELLLGAADTFDSEADAAINRFIAIFPAILILLLALVIGFIIAATLLPIVAMQLGGGL